jgi:hypothetical protein
MSAALELLILVRAASVVLTVYALVRSIAIDLKHAGG